MLVTFKDLVIRDIVLQLENKKRKIIYTYVRETNQVLHLCSL